MRNIKGNLINNAGTGIMVDGSATVHGNTIKNVRTGIVVEPNFKGDITDNNISEVQNIAILVNDHNPYDFFGISTDIDKSELLELFKKLDESHIDNHLKIAEESKLAKFDQFTSIIERLDKFTKEYGPSLAITFGPYLELIR